jgi:serine/threonine-protein kinase haspin
VWTVLLLLLALTFTFMLGSRTKQVFSYGKRSQRIVNVSEERGSSKETGSIFDDLEPVQWAPIASRMKKRENNIPSKPRTSSPKVIRMNRRKRLSPMLPSAKKQHRLAQIMDAEATKRELSSTTKASSSKAALDTAPIPPRTPFGHFTLNVPGSPAIPVGWSPPAMGPPLKRNKPFSPFVDMDIIILDENGKTVKQERRVSRTDVEVNPFNPGNANKLKGPFAQGKSSQHPTNPADSDSDLMEQSKRPKRMARRAPLTVYSDDSESDDGDSVPIPQAPKKATVSHSSLNHGVSAESSRAVNPIHPNKPIIKTASSQLVLPQALPAHVTSYQPLPSPPLRSRQLTPIRGSHGRHLYEPPSPPSPACTDLDFSLEFEELKLASLSHVDASYRSEPEHPTYLRPLLQECHQEDRGPIEFSSFIDTFPFDPVIQSEDGKPTGATFKKVGEASYSEVFGIGDVVLKVIPLRDESNDEASTNKLKMNVKCNDSGEVEDGPAPSDAKDVRKEIIVTRAMGEVCDGFVKLLKTYIVRGKYPEVLLRLWDEYHETKGSESVRPGRSYTSFKFCHSCVLNYTPLRYTIRFLPRFTDVRYHCAA